MKRVALALIASSASVSAFVPACRVTVAWEYRAVVRAIHRHHSAATLARWKVGAAKWSLAHGGKVYQGVQVRRFDWVPTVMPCSDVATVPVELTSLFPYVETLPGFAAYAAPFPPGATAPPLTPDTPSTRSEGPVWSFPGGAGGYAPIFPPAIPVVPTPEPGTWVLVATGALVAMMVRR